MKRLATSFTFKMLQWTTAKKKELKDYTSTKAWIRTKQIKLFL